jgi:hypothetical protein
MDDRALFGGLAVAAVALYAKGVPQRLYAAIFAGRGTTLGEALPAATLPQSLGGGGGSAGSGSTTPTPTGAIISPAQLATFERSVAVAGPNGAAGTSWLDWCLQYMNTLYTKATGRTAPELTLPTAGAACAAQPLRGGNAPAGAAVCIGSNHIGVSNGDGTYTSAGLVAGSGIGGIVTAPYANNPNYRGWFAP